MTRSSRRNVKILNELACASRKRKPPGAAFRFSATRVARVPRDWKLRRASGCGLTIDSPSNYERATGATVPSSALERRVIRWRAPSPCPRSRTRESTADSISAPIARDRLVKFDDSERRKRRLARRGESCRSPQIYSYLRDAELRPVPRRIGFFECACPPPSSPSAPPPLFTPIPYPTSVLSPPSSRSGPSNRAFEM